MTHERARQYIILMRLHKPVGILLLLWPTLWALLLASKGHPSIKMLVVFVLGTTLMRTAGCIINDIADKNVDGSVARTRERPLVTQKISTKKALILFAMICLLAFCLALTLNKLALLLAVPAVMLAISYPFMKRIMPIPQLILGVAFSWGIPMAFAATNNTLPNIAWMLMLANTCWTIAYDTEYAMVDREDDLKIGIHSSAIFFGHYDRLMIMLLQVSALTLLWVIGLLAKLSTWYDLCLVISALLIVYQGYLIYHRDRIKCFHAFNNNIWVGMLITLGIVLSYTW